MAAPAESGFKRLILQSCCFGSIHERGANVAADPADGDDDTAQQRSFQRQMNPKHG